MAVSPYETAHGSESDLPRYQLNLATAHLVLNKCILPYLLTIHLCAYASFHQN